ncbi:MAG: zf-HC2 domain-containing protein [Acidobacteria bacterium]|nr:zf-HC2 domain-containing protein [Acidobacteriota bacterium]
MECREAVDHLQDLLDGDIEETQAESVRAHLGLCSGCAAEFHLQREMRRAVREGATQHLAPARLRAVVRSVGDLRPGWWMRWWVPATALLLVISLGALFYLAAAPFRRVGTSPLITEAVNDYIRFAQRARPEEVTGSDPGRLITWFQGKLDFGFTLPDEGPKEFQLVGGGLSYFLERKVACLLYRKGPHMIALSVLKRDGVEVPPRSADTQRLPPFHVAKHHGFTVIIWQRDDLVYSLVSDLDAKELSPLATSLART